MTLAGEVSLWRQRLTGDGHCKEPLLIHPASCGQPSRNSCIMHLHLPWTMLLESTEASWCYLFALNGVILSKVPGCCILPHPGLSVNHLCAQSIRASEPQAATSGNAGCWDHFQATLPSQRLRKAVGRITTTNFELSNRIQNKVGEEITNSSWDIFCCLLVG